MQGEPDDLGWERGGLALHRRRWRALGVQLTGLQESDETLTGHLQVTRG